MSRLFFFFSSRRRHTRFDCDWSSDVCSSDLPIRGQHIEQLHLVVRGAIGTVDGGAGGGAGECPRGRGSAVGDTRGSDRKSTRLNSSHSQISYAVFCLKKKKKTHTIQLHHLSE